MIVEFDQDGLGGGQQGYGRLLITVDDYDNVTLDENDSIAIGKKDSQNNSEYLDPVRKGWIAMPKPLMFEKRPEIDGDRGEFLLQAAYLDQLDSNTYDILLMGKDGVKAEGRAFLDINIHSPIRGSAAFIRGWNTQEEPEEEEPEEKAVEEPAPEETGASNPVREEAPAVEETAEEKPGDGEETEEEEPLWEEEPEEEETWAPPPYGGGNSGSKKMIIGVAVLLAVLAAAGGAFFFLRGNAGNEEAEMARQEQQAAEKAAAEKAAAERKAAQEKEAAEKAAAATPRARVNEFFKGKQDANAAIELAKELNPETPEDKDAVFRLYYYAAQNGNPEGAKRYAETLDPTRAGWGSIKKDGAEAWKYYEQAPNGGEARAKLKAWVEQQAKAGNRVARGWLEEMQ